MEGQEWRCRGEDVEGWVDVWAEEWGGAGVWGCVAEVNEA